MAKASINFQPAGRGAVRHNDRSTKQEPEYLLPNTFREKNEVDRPGIEAEKLIEKLRQEAAENYLKKFGQRMQTKKYVWEAVVNLNKEHTLEDVQRLTRAIEKETGFTGVQIAIHRDEGHINERGVAIRNYHAHLVFFTLDRQTGQQLYRRSLTERQRKERPDLRPMDRARLSDLQDLAAEVLQMKRGIRGSRAQRMGHKQYRSAIKKKQVWEKLAKINMAKVREVKAEAAKLREELRAARAQRPQYAAMEAEVKRLREQAISKDLTIEGLRAEMEALRADLLASIEREKADKAHIKTAAELAVIDAEQELAEANDALIIVQKRAKKAENELQATQTCLNDLKAENEALRAENGKMKQLVEELEKWKRSISQVLRELGRFFGLRSSKPEEIAAQLSAGIAIEEAEERNNKYEFPPMEGYEGPGFGGPKI